MAISIQQYRALLTDYLRPQRSRVVLLAILVGGSIALQLLNPQILRSFIDSALAGGTLQALMNAAVLFLLIAFAQQLVAVAATYTGENVGWTATNQLRADLAAHCLRLDIAFHK